MSYKEKITNQELYLGKNCNKDYFEGWYFKQSTNDFKYTISFIPGISKGTDEHAFIQIINNITNKSYYIRFDIEDFSFSNNPFYVKIGNNLFSLDYIHIDIDKEVKIKGDLYYQNKTPIDKNFYAPNIMGPFAYLPFMECYHAVLSLRSTVNGIMNINNQNLYFENGIGYIEKDYGTSFPNQYLWLQGNNKEDTIFLSIADIPFKGFRFNGFISILMINGKQYRLSTYHFGKIKTFNKHKLGYDIKIKQGEYLLEITLKQGDLIDLISPKNGNMTNTILESLNSNLEVQLTKQKKLIYKGTFTPCTSEIVGY